jgi:triosephosphate isomerase
MRKPLVAGNWKMNKTIAESRDLTNKIKARQGNNSTVEVVVAPPFTALSTVAETIQGSSIQLAGQNLYFQPSGAYTGEISPGMLVDSGCRYVILGHSERRKYFGETDSLTNEKIHAALQVGLKPVLCVGETEEEKESGSTEAVVTRQLERGLVKIAPDKIDFLVIAYEPVWAIGTGKNATPESAQKVHMLIRGHLDGILGSGAGDRIRILYGGSVSPGNASGLMSQPDIDGALVGGASLVADSFCDIIDSVH